MSRAELRQLRRGQRLRDRRGRLWAVHAEAFEADGWAHIVIRSGDLVRRVHERFADDYMLVADDPAP